MSRGVLVGLQRIVFWQPIESPHQHDFLEALAAAARMVFAALSCTSSMGWLLALLVVFAIPSSTATIVGLKEVSGPAAGASPGLCDAVGGGVLIASRPCLMAT